MKNVIYDDGSELKPGFTDYTYNIIKHLKRLLSNFDDYLFIVYNHLGTTPPISRNFRHDKKILFWEAGEKKQQPFDDIKSDYLVIFCNYAASKSNVYSIPLGYWDNRVNGKIVPVFERNFGMSFVGCLNRNRVHLAKLLSGRSREWIALGLLRRQKKTLETINRIIQWKYTTDYFMFTEDFAAGLERDKYSYYLRNSKIVLCPREWTNAETFRMYEAMKHECVVITEKLPDREYYKNIPVIQIERWKEGLEVAETLLTNENELVRMGKVNREFYETHFAPGVVAKNILLIINELQQKRK